MRRKIKEEEGKGGFKLLVKAVGWDRFGLEMGVLLIEEWEGMRDVRKGKGKGKGKGMV